MFASASCNTLAQMKLSLDGELRRVREDVEGFLRFTRRTKDEMSTAVQIVARQVVLDLEGRTLDRGTLIDAEFDEGALVPRLAAVRGGSLRGGAQAALRARLADGEAGERVGDPVSGEQRGVSTGIRADVSQTLVGLGIDLSGLVVHGTLQRGIAYAIRRTGQGAQTADRGARGPGDLRAPIR